MIGSGSLPVDPFLITDSPLPGFSDVSGRTEVSLSLAPGESTGLFVTFGQSLAANHGEAGYAVIHADKVQNLNPYDKKVYRCADPTLGASGTLGGYHGQIGDRLINQGTFQRVIFITVAIGATLISQWVPGGEHDNRLRVALLCARLVAQPITAVHLQIGESDNFSGTPAAAWKNSFTQVLGTVRGYTAAPLFVAKSTRYPDLGTSDALRGAVDGVIDHAAGVFLGADTDPLAGPANRTDTGHLTNLAQGAAAALWANIYGDHFGT